MRALTFQGNGRVSVEDVDEPVIEQPTDALVDITMAGICGSDLHVLHAGEQFEFGAGARLGHEFIGTVAAVGEEVSGFSAGDRVMVAAGVSCGGCDFCHEDSEYSCVQGSMFGWAPRLWQHGGAVQGGQAEMARVPLAAHTMKKMPEALAAPEHEAKLLPLVDVMSTGWHGLESAGFQAGQSAVVIGDGAVGLCAVHGAAARGAEHVICLGHHPDRLAIATSLGATHIIESRDPEEIAERVGEITGGQGVHCVVDSISGGESMTTAYGCVRPGGTISCLGMDHFLGNVPEMNWYAQFVKNITVTGGLIPMGNYIPQLVEMVVADTLDPSPVLTTHLPLAEAADGYAKMESREEGVVKVALATS